jgi:protein phosphatase
MAKEIEIPKRALAVLCGPSAAGKTTWARQHFLSSQIISSDKCRQMVADDVLWHQPGVSAGAFELLYLWTEQRLKLNRLAVVDSTALLTGTRRHLLRLARRWHAPAVLIVFESDPATCAERDAARSQSVGPRVLRRQFKQLAHERAMFTRERWDALISLDEESQAQNPVRLSPLPHERPDDAGPFDIVGDVHGCRVELLRLLEKLGWEEDSDGVPAHPAGRRLIFVGDLGCGGPDSVGAWELALRLRACGRAEVLIGDHDVRFVRHLRGEAVRLDRGLDRAAAELRRLPAERLTHLRQGLDDLMGSAPPHLLLDNGQLAVAHAALPDHMVGKDDRRVRDFCRHAEGSRGAGRGEWVMRHLGHELVVHGHAPTRAPRIINHTVNIDTGCVLGGALTAFRWPERELVQVPAEAVHWGDGWSAGDEPISDHSLEPSVA